MIQPPESAWDSMVTPLPLHAMFSEHLVPSTDVLQAHATRTHFWKDVGWRSATASVSGVMVCHLLPWSMCVHVYTCVLSVCVHVSCVSWVCMCVVCTVMSACACVSCVHVLSALHVDICVTCVHTCVCTCVSCRVCIVCVCTCRACAHVCGACMCVICVHVCVVWMCACTCACAHVCACVWSVCACVHV